MSVNSINGAALRAMVAAGTARLEQFKAQVDALNVFPVPDGDTGTNMTLTMQAATRETAACPSNTLADVAAAMSRGALKGARGNSGVILSQMLRGFATVAINYEEMGPQQMADAFCAASEMAYKALMKPKEGTILTVGRVMGESAQSAVRFGDIDSVMRSVLSSGEEILKMTPDMLPVLKQAGVVDAGGRGLIHIYEGFWQALSGEIPTVALPATVGESAEITDIPHLENLE
ncbi:MAG: DAK2 domain-containing protein, partial [Clostridia bacterium]|nr:DAK2 domain-containing protein [Clostridia bacterium]